MDIEDFRKELDKIAKQDVCPDCGRCPTCGKRNYWPRPLPSFTPVSYNPPYPYRPIGPYWGDTTY